MSAETSGKLLTICQGTQTLPIVTKKSTSKAKLCLNNTKILKIYNFLNAALSGNSNSYSLPNQCFELVTQGLQKYYNHTVTGFVFNTVLYIRYKHSLVYNLQLSLYSTVQHIISENINLV